MSFDSPFGLPLRVDMPSIDPDEWIELDDDEVEEEDF